MDIEVRSCSMPFEFFSGVLEIYSELDFEINLASFIRFFWLCLSTAFLHPALMRVFSVSLLTNVSDERAMLTSSVALIVSELSRKAIMAASAMLSLFS